MGEETASPRRDRDSPPRGPRDRGNGGGDRSKEMEGGDSYRPGDTPLERKPDSPPRAPRDRGNNRGDRSKQMEEGDSYRPGGDRGDRDRDRNRDRDGNSRRDGDRDSNRDNDRERGSERQRDRDFDRPRDRDQDRDRRPRRGGGGFKWKDERRNDGRRNDDRRNDDRRRDDRPYRRRSRSPRRRDDRDRPRDSRPSDKDKKPAAAPAAPAAPAGGEEMIIVHVNDRLGTKAAIPCYASDRIKEFKIMVAARIGREPHEILLKRQGERPFKDQLSLEDYGVGNGVQLDLEVDTGD